VVGAVPASGNVGVEAGCTLVVPVFKPPENIPPPPNAGVEFGILNPGVAPAPVVFVTLNDGVDAAPPKANEDVAGFGVDAWNPNPGVLCAGVKEEAGVLVDPPNRLVVVCVLPNAGAEDEAAPNAGVEAAPNDGVALAPNPPKAGVVEVEAPKAGVEAAVLSPNAGWLCCGAPNAAGAAVPTEVDPNAGVELAPKPPPAAPKAGVDAGVLDPKPPKEGVELAAPKAPPVVGAVDPNALPPKAGVCVPPNGLEAGCEAG
jgi:hypothetical protein